MSFLIKPPIAATFKFSSSAIIAVFCIEDQDKLKEEIAKADILVNGTLAGMKPHEDVSLITDKSVFRPDLVVCDVVYNPELLIGMVN